MNNNLYRYCHMCKHSNHGKRDITTYMCYSCGQRDVNNFESEIDINSFYPQYDDIPDTVRLMKLAAHSIYGYPRPPKGVPTIKNVIFNDPATIVFWADGTKTVVKCQEGDIYDPEKGMAMAICKKALGNQGNYCEVFKKWLPEEEEDKLNGFTSEEFVRAIRNIGKANNMLEKFISDKLMRMCCDLAVKKEESAEYLRCTVCQNIRFDDDQESYYCTLDGKTIDPADPACQYFDHETMTCWDCKMSECIPVNEEGSCVDLMCMTTGEKPIDRSEPACRNFVLRK